MHQFEIYFNNKSHDFERILIFYLDAYTIVQKFHISDRTYKAILSILCDSEFCQFIISLVEEL